MKDGGYDVADYYSIDPRFGTLDDFKKLVTAAHDHGLLVIIDQVLGHTSVEHPWFQKSIACEDGYDDWYVWCDPKEDGSLPNNWMSRFGPPAWTWNHKREQYYFHQYLASQPRLNLYNEDVQNELKNNIRHWKDLGVDGFRFDAISSYLYDKEFRDNPPLSQDLMGMVASENFMPYARQDHQYDLLPNKCHHVAEMIIDTAGEDCFTIGELTVNIKSLELIKEYTRDNGLNTAYTDDIPQQGLSRQTIVTILQSIGTDHYDFSWWMYNHDKPRYDGDEDRRVSYYKFILMLLSVMPGPVLFYQGQELGLPQQHLNKDEVTDPYDLEFWPDGPGREGARVPLPWTEDSKNHYGFTNCIPWLPMRWFEGLSVESQDKDKASLLNFSRDLLKTRKEFQWGSVPISYEELDDHVLKVEWQFNQKQFVAYFNLSSDKKQKAHHLSDIHILYKSHDTMMDEYPPYSAIIGEL